MVAAETHMTPNRASVAQIKTVLRGLGSRRNIEGMARYGITTKKVFGVGVVPLRKLAKQIGRNQELSLRLWKTGYLEARILAALIGDPGQATVAQMNRWVRDFDNWAVCDSCCSVLFDKTPFAQRQAVFWSRRREEFVRRAGFVLMATLAVHDKSLPDTAFVKFFPLIKKGSDDERNFVMKAVNWALRQIGKRNVSLNRKATILARGIARRNSRPARWIAFDALRELTDPRVLARIRRGRRH